MTDAGKLAYIGRRVFMILMCNLPVSRSTLFRSGLTVSLIR
jgi:hypothetical protein